MWFVGPVVDDPNDLDELFDRSDDERNPPKPPAPAPVVGLLPFEFGMTLKPQVQTIVKEGWKPPPLQPPFQPSSSPVHLEHSYMVWNSVGVVRRYHTDEEQSIDIEFHDTSHHHAMHVVNTMNHSMADLNAEAVALACESDEENPRSVLA